MAGVALADIQFCVACMISAPPTVLFPPHAQGACGRNANVSNGIGVQASLVASLTADG